MLHNLHKCVTRDAFRSHFRRLSLVKYFSTVIEGVFSRLTGRLAALVDVQTDYQIVSWQRICTFYPPFAANHSSAWLLQRALALFSCQPQQHQVIIRCALWHVNNQTKQWVGQWSRLKSGIPSGKKIASVTNTKIIRTNEGTLSTTLGLW